MRASISVVVFSLITLIATGQSPEHDLRFDELATQWDEAIPLGNGTVGALVWQKENQLRFSLDRSDLWDLRPMNGLHREEFSYQWVADQVRKNDYGVVQQYFDAPYDREPAPTKILGGALEFSTENWGEVESVHLSLADAVCEVRWSSGITLNTFVDAVKPVGWFRFEKIDADFIPQLVAPRYQGAVTHTGDPVGGDDLSRLGYEQGTIQRAGNSIVYHQKGWGGFSYDIAVHWKREDAHTIEGVWSISSRFPDGQPGADAAEVTAAAIATDYRQEYTAHAAWWASFWDQSAIYVPDPLLEKQWYLEQYKFGSLAREDAPPISLQGVWTADNGRIPPWKGDYHHDLNTQLSYWPAYSGNHLVGAMGYINHFEANKANYKRYTRMYFDSEGIAVPGVTTLDGTEMGGWIQYALSPTVSAWLGQHYYLQWRYSMDRDFLKDKAYPWIRDVAVLLESITIPDAHGVRNLKISSSPEVNNNDIGAWFLQNTNYDLALMKFTYEVAEELAHELGLPQEAARWAQLATEFGDFALSGNDELMIAPTLAYAESHRHLSHLMAIHPLGLIKWEDGEKAQSTINNSIQLLDRIGPDYWTGYSYSWSANLKARAKDGLGAASDLRTFARAFCSVNSFHVNGDQTQSGLSNFTYRPFTLEGNFAFAAGLQEMLLQSYAGFIEIMPAIPAEWRDVAFEDLRAEGAFLVSARKVDGRIDELKIISEQGGTTKLKLPFTDYRTVSNSGFDMADSKDGFLELTGEPEAELVLRQRF